MIMFLLLELCMFHRKHIIYIYYLVYCHSRDQVDVTYYYLVKIIP